MTTRSDTFSNQDLASVVVANSVTQDTNGSSVDLSNVCGATFYAAYGTNTTATDGSNNLQLELEHSDDNVTFTDCADSEVRGSVTGTNTGTFAVFDNGTADDGAIAKAAYIGGKRYVRVVANVTGSVDAPLTVLAGTDEDYMPVTVTNPS